MGRADHIGALRPYRNFLSGSQAFLDGNCVHNAIGRQGKLRPFSPSNGRLVVSI
jgi:hypothetical protein